MSWTTNARSSCITRRYFKFESKNCRSRDAKLTVGISAQVCLHKDDSKRPHISIEGVLVSDDTLRRHVSDGANPRSASGISAIARSAACAKLRFRRLDSDMHFTLPLSMPHVDRLRVDCVCDRVGHKARFDRVCQSRKLIMP